MKTKTFSDILSHIDQELMRYRLQNFKKTGQEFPLFSFSGQPTSNSGRHISARGTPLYRILQMEETLYLDIECYAHGQASEYTFWSYMPQPDPNHASIYLFRYDQNRNLPHRHDFTELIFVYDGTYTVEIDGTKRIFVKNDICILNPNCEHQELETECNGIFLYLGFRTRTISEQFRQELPPGTISTFLSENQKQSARYLVLHLPEDQTEQDMEYFTRIFQELQNPGIGSHLMKQLLLVRLIQYLEYNCANRTETISTRDNGIYLFEKILAYIEEHLDTVNISELKEKFHYQEDYYNRLFQKTMGISFRTYLHQEKIKQAKFLLRESDLSIQRIMDQIGYCSRPHFFSVFQQETGMTPMTYRKKHRFQVASLIDSPTDQKHHRNS